MSLAAAIGNDALAALSTPGFREAWETLYSRCPWATGRQSLAFVEAWYQVYESGFSPVIVFDRLPNGALAGVLPLAVSIEKGELIVACGPAAEYKGWLSPPDDEGAFIIKALRLVRKKFPGQTLAFGYLPPKTPLDFLRRDNELRSYCRHRRCHRPLVFLNEERQSEYLTKKSNRSRLNRLKKIGPLSFERIIERSEAEALMAEVAAQCDFRHAAVHDTMRYRGNPANARFDLTLLEKSLLHFTVFKAGSHLLSAHLGVIDPKRKNVSLGMICHSSRHSRHSPGKFHLRMLSRHLLEEGFTCLDLTPDHEYKDRFASSYDEVSMLIMYGDRRQCMTAAAKTAVSDAIKALLRVMRFSPDPLIYAIERLRDLTDLGLKKNISRLLSRRRPRVVYSCKVGSARAEAVPTMSKNNISDLLALNASRMPALVRKEFFADAWKRLEKGQCCYTRLGADGSLIQCGWLIERGEDALAGDAPPGAQAAGAAILVVPGADLFARDVSLLEQCIKHMLADVLTATYVYISLDRGDSVARGVVEKLGFELNSGTARPQHPLLSRIEKPREPLIRAAEVEPQYGVQEEVVYLTLDNACAADERAAPVDGFI